MGNKTLLEKIYSALGFGNIVKRQIMELTMYFTGVAYLMENFLENLIYLE